MEKLYRVKMNENGMPNFSTAEEVEPKHGEWIYVTVEEWMKTGRDYGHHCSDTGCGSKLKGADDED